MGKKLRIGFVDYVLEPDKPGASGLSNIVWDMAKALVRIGHEVHVVASYHTQRFPFPEIIVHNFPTPPIGYRNILGHIWILKRAGEILNSLSLDILHTPEYLSSALFSMMGLDSPLVLTVPGNIYERIENGNPFDKVTTQVLKIAARVSARKCTRIIVTSKKMVEWWLKTGTQASRMALIPYGVDSDLFKETPGGRTQLGVSPETEVVLFVGRFSAEKGLEDLLIATRLLCNMHPGVELHLVGNGDEEKHLHDLVHQLRIDQSVVFHGQIPKILLPVYYSMADVTVLPSRSEGMPRTMIEAMACGSPFLGTKITGIEDHVKDQVTGFLVEPGNPEMLSNKIGSILGEPVKTRKVAINGAEYVRTNLAWGIIVRRIQDEVYFAVA